MLSKFQTILFRNSPAIAWAVLILALCGIPGKQIPVFSWADAITFDKWVHALLFGVLCWFIFRGNIRAGVNPWALLTTALCLSVGYGWLTEWLQVIWFTDRTGDLLDGLANTVGALIACGFIRYRFRVIFK